MELHAPRRVFATGMQVKGDVAGWLTSDHVLACGVLLVGPHQLQLPGAVTGVADAGDAVAEGLPWLELEKPMPAAT